MNSNWEAGKLQSNYHFNWNSKQLAGYDYRWIARYTGDWDTELNDVKKLAEPKTWKTRGKDYHPDHPDLLAEENDLKNAGMSTDTVIFRKHFNFDGIWQKFLDPLGLLNIKKAFHIQYPGELINLHIDKQYEMNDDPSQVARFFIFLEDWKPGHFLQIGTSFLQWQKGDLVWFDWPNIPHASANAGWEPRCLMQITGTMTDTTKQLLLNKKDININGKQ